MLDKDLFPSSFHSHVGRVLGLCEVKVQFTACDVALLLYNALSPAPVPQLALLGIKATKPTQQEVLFLSELFGGFVLVDSFIHLLFLVSEQSLSLEGEIYWLVLAASYLKSCHFNF